jgi:outer membrane protein assembly factor BamB
LSDGVLYFTSYDGKLYALEASSGKKLGSFDSGAEIYSSPAVSNNMVYFGANNGYFYCLQAASH